MSIAAIAAAPPQGPGIARLAAHEFRLAWRDWRHLITGGNRRSFALALLILLLVGLALHLPAYAMVERFAGDGIHPGKDELLPVTVIFLLFASLLLSQAMETVTRSLYSRGDLELLLSSPVPVARLFAVRIVANGALVALMGVILTAPFINVLVLAGGARWLSAYVVAAATGFAMSALAVTIVMVLFHRLGPRRTRLVAQIAAAAIGTIFAIGLQVTAILAYGSLSSASLSASPELLSALPDADNPVWLPARAVYGDWPVAVALAVIAVLAMAAVVVAFAPRLGEDSVAAAGLPQSNRGRSGEQVFRVQTTPRAMRRKEWLLLLRDPWLASQTLTQLLYLLPPALLLARGFNNSNGALVVIVIVLVTVGGQLAGALAWLAISGEDAPELVATAPVSPHAVVRAKVEAVFGAVGVIVAPLIAGLAILSPVHAVVAAAGVAMAAGSTIAIQFWFRAQSKRSNFRRRHTSSRIATFGEALVSFSWAGAAGFAAAGSVFAILGAVSAVIVLLLVRAVSPRRVPA